MPASSPLIWVSGVFVCLILLAVVFASFVWTFGGYFFLLLCNKAIALARKAKDKKEQNVLSLHPFLSVLFIQIYIYMCFAFFVGFSLHGILSLPSLPFPAVFIPALLR